MPDVRIPAEAEEQVVPTDSVQRLGRLPVKRRGCAGTDEARQPLLSGDGDADQAAEAV